ncbi:MAG: hypothetical protein J7J76_04840 [Candidatus Latescibacteria bacterium]|nr:hypothetical protein [Candidatus Latescibacterota bacterium]
MKDDEALVDRMRSDDRAALDEIFCRYSEKAYRLAYDMLGDCEDARDVCQDAFIRFLQDGR